MIHVECPHCRKSYEVADPIAGKVAKCRECGAKIPIPEWPAEAEPERSRSASPNRASKKATRATNLSKFARSANDQNDPPKTASAESPSKSSGSKSTAAKHNPNAKEITSEDVFEDEFAEIDDDMEELESFDDSEDYRSSPRRSRRNKKPKNSSLKISFGWLSWIGGFLRKDVTGLTLLLLGIGVFVLMVNVGPGRWMAMNQEAWIVFVGGVALLLVGNLWLTVRIWRVNPQWAGIFLGSGVALRALSRFVPVEVVYGLEGIRGIALIAFVVDHWSDVKTPFVTYLLGFCLFICALVGLVPGGNPMAAKNINPGAPAQAPFQMPAPAAAPAIRRNDRGFPNTVVAQNAVDADQRNVGRFPLETVRMAELPEFSLGAGGRGETFSDPSVTCMRLFFINAKSNSKLTATVPGVNTKMIYFEPKGTHSARSLPCVLIASAGTNLLEGADCPSKEYVSEMLPYVKAGFAVLGFSLDGYSTQKIGLSDQQLVCVHFTQFQKAQAGLVNVRNVVEFASQKIPQVDPQRLFIAGHSSAATLALLAAAHEPRLKAAVAYAPATDVETRLKDVLNAPDAEQVLPGVRRFAKQSSPLTHVERIGCPVFLFHAADDANVSAAESRRFAELLRSNGKTVEYVEVPSGNHYDSMIQQGIPRAIPWLKKLAATNGSIPDIPLVATVPPTGDPAAPSTSDSSAASKAVPGADANLSAGVLQPSGRVVTFRFQYFSGNGDPAAAARQALRNVSWADLNDIVIDPATNEIRIGQLGGFANSEPARQALLAAGFQLVGGVSIGAKKPASSATTEPTRPAKSEPAAPVTSSPTENPFATKTPPSKGVSKPATLTGTEPVAPKKSGPRRVVTFRYERYSGKGSSINAVTTAFKKIAWADPNDIEIDTAKREIRIGQLEESKEYEPAEKALKNAGFSLTPGVTSGLRKR